MAIEKWGYEIQDNVCIQMTHSQSAGYWEANFMCHIIRFFGCYANMYYMPVARFDDRGDVLRTLEYAIQRVPPGQLSPATISAISAELQGVRERFLQVYDESVIMLHLYMWPKAVPFDQVMLDAFDRIQDLVQQDTKSQIDDTGQPRFDRPCKLCLPFLNVLKKTQDPVPQDAMGFHIWHLGRYSLEDLYKKKLTEMNGNERKATKDAKGNGIFSRPGDPIAFMGSGKRTDEYKGQDPGNDLICVNDACETNTDTFCSTAEGGGCSAMSDY